MSGNEAIFLLLMSLGALFMPIISKKLLLPSAVGEILYGTLLASASLSLPKTLMNNGDLRMVQYFSSLGFMLLMYIAGLEINFEKMKALPKRELFLYALLFLPTALMGFYITHYLNMHWAFTLIFFTTGIGLLFPVLKDTNLIQSDFGQKLLIIGMIGEILTLMGLTSLTLSTKYGSTFQLDTIINIAYIVGFIIVIYIFLKILRTLLWWKPHLQSLFLQVSDSNETGIRTNFVILFAFITFAGIANIEFVVGAFIGGAILALVFADRRSVLDKLNGLGYGFFIPIFFISVGMQVTFKDFVNIEVLKLALIIIAGMFICKLAGTLVLIYSKISIQTLPLITTGLSFPLTMLVAVSSVCQELGVINKTEASAILLAAMGSAIIFPWAFKLLLNVVMVRESLEVKE